MPKQFKPNRVGIREDYVVMFIDSPKYKTLEVLLDHEDYERLKNHRWCFSMGNYAATNIMQDGKYKPITMHTMILSDRPKGQCIDHKNQNKLDNRRSNLQVTSYRYNLTNSKPRNPTGEKNINLRKNGKYVVRFNFKGKFHHYGCFDTLEQAKIARDKGKKELHEKEMYEVMLQQAMNTYTISPVVAGINLIPDNYIFADGFRFTKYDNRMEVKISG